MPIALLLAAIAIPVIGLYILKVRLRRIPVSTNLFWNQIFEEKPPKSLWQNLRHWLSLLAQLLILAFLVLAIADPILSWQSASARRVVLIMDISASMKAADVEPTRFAAAQKSAQRFLDGVRERDNVAILSAGAQPEVVLGMGNHAPSLRRAIDELKPVDTHESIESAITLAKQLIGDSPKGQILVFTDREDERDRSDQSDRSDLRDRSDRSDRSDLGDRSDRSDQTDLIDRSDQTDQTDLLVEFRSVGTDAGNVGITQFQTRRSMVDAVGYEILVEVKNASDVPVNCRLEIELGERPVDILPLKLQPNETWSRTLEKTSLDGGVLKASLTKWEPEEGTSTVLNNQLDVDDVAWAILPARVIQPVLIVSPGNLFLQKVFEANPLVSVTVAKELPTSWPANTVIVLHKLIPTELPPNPLLIIDPDNDCNLFKLDGNIDNPLVTEQNKESPLMTHVRLDNVTFPNTKKISFLTETVQSLASSVDGDSLFSVAQNGNSRVVVLGVNLEESDLAFRTVFPILASNTIAWFTGQSGELSLSLPGGATTLLKDPPAQATEAKASKRLWLVSPTGSVQPHSGQTVGPLNQTGVWELMSLSGDANVSTKSESSSTNAPTLEEISKNGTLVERFAVNLKNPAETDLRRKTTDQTSATTSAMASWLSYPLWFYLAVIISLLLVAEWGMYQRRVIA
ncbi:MAG: VWA domain-containing protein [Pirellula sp.]|nr:VWA domain-containing protein [Pirellula sp.]